MLVKLLYLSLPVLSLLFLLQAYVAPFTLKRGLLSLLFLFLKLANLLIQVSDHRAAVMALRALENAHKIKTRMKDKYNG